MEIRLQNNKVTWQYFIGISSWALAALFFLYEFFLRTFVGSLAHQIMAELQLNAKTFSLMSTAYYLAYSIMQIPVGLLIDRFGVKLVMLLATLICALSTLLFASTDHFFTAFFSRFLMGFGSSFAFVCLLVIVVSWFPRKYFAFLIGLSQFIGTMGPLLAGGPLIVLLEHSDQSWRMWLEKIALLGLLLTILTALIVRNKPNTDPKKLIYLQAGNNITAQLKKLLYNRQAITIALYSAMNFCSIALLSDVWGTRYLETQGFSQVNAANMISYTWLSYAISCPLVGFLSDFYKRRKIFLIGCALLNLFSTFYLIFLHVSSIYYEMLLFILLGCGSAGQSIGFAIITEQVNLGNKATALGLNNAGMTLFAAILPVISGFFIDFELAKHVEQGMQAGDFVLGLSVMPLACLGSLLLAIFFIEETYCKPQKETILLKV